MAWFEKSNQWVQMDEPQRFIFLLYTRGVSRENALREFDTTFHHSKHQSQSLVHNLYDSLEQLNRQGFARPDFGRDAAAACQHTLNRYRTHHYQWGNRSFALRYGSASLEEYIHLPLAHLTVEEKTDSPLLLEVFPFGNRFAMRINGRRCVTAEEAPQLKRLLFVELASHLFGISEDGWMTHLHASAVEKDEKLLLLSSASGSGKSTLAALLLKEGFRFFSDDFVPVCLQKQWLYPFPPALCIKKGSLPVMKREGIEPHIIHRHTGYIQAQPHDLQPRRARDLVFVKYSPEGSFGFDHVPPSRALQLFLQEAWVCDHYNGVKQFIQWFEHLRFYQLTYSRKEDAIEALVHVLNKR